MRLTEAFEAIDATNDADPSQLTTGDGRRVPKARWQGERATVWLERRCADDPERPSQALELAARAHHLCRFEIPRNSYPTGRAGYLRWRRDEKRHQATRLREVLGPVGTPTEVVERAAAIVQKLELGSDPEVQRFEDVVCLVFCETELDELLERIGPDKLRAAVIKTAAKMSPAGLALLPEATPQGPGRTLVLSLLA